MIGFYPIRDWRTFWQFCDSIEDVSRLFDDKTPYTRQGMKRRIKELVEDTKNMSFGITCNGAKAGCFMLCFIENGCYMVHIVLKSAFRGRKGIEIGKAGTDYSLTLPNVKQLVSMCPEAIPEAFVFAKLCGWRDLGLLPLKWLKGGINHNVRGVACQH